MKLQSDKLFCFTLENQQFAIPIDAAGEVLMATAVMPVPNSPQVIHGLIDYHGLIVPVINLRYKLSFPQKPISTRDVFIIADTSKRKIALVADSATGVIAPGPNELFSAIEIDPGLSTAGFLRRDDGIVLIYDLENFLSNDEDLHLMAAIEQQTNES
jgi:purine-binding chemotaxis protein CheW